MSSFVQELAELRRWTPRSPTANLRKFEQLVVHEFQSAEQHDAMQARDLAALLQFAAAHVPYYRNLWRKLALSPAEIGSPRELFRLPILTKRDVMDSAEALRAEWLPAGEGPPHPYESTGTTGQPVKVFMSRSGSAMFALLWHRQARWFRYDLNGCFAKIRIPSALPRQKDGTPLPLGTALCRPHWRYVGASFETGREVIFSVSNPIDQQIAWLQRHRPDYLLAYPGFFEELALACGSAPPVDSLKSLLAIGSCVTPSMRTWIERIYRIPLDQNYGLNEVGLVAIRCAAGRYHANTEHCLVEIVDDQGRPAPPGASGRVLVTALQNLAMPLIRYDTGDIAMAAEGPCPCGRTLPSFGEIAGRYRRFAGLPPGTRERVRALLGSFEAIPAEMLRNLRRFQVYQDRENRFELRLATAGPMPPNFSVLIRERWRVACGDSPLPLSIIEGAMIASSPGGKHLDFDSAFYSPDDQASRAKIEERINSKE